MGGKARSAQWGLDLARQRGETTPRNRFEPCPGSTTTFPFAECWSTFSTAPRIPPTGAAAGFPYCSPDAANTFPRRTDRGRRLRLGLGPRVQRPRDGRGRRDYFGWGTRICGLDRRKRCAGVPAGSGGRRVRQGRRAERLGRVSGTPLPKGGASLRATLAAVGSGQAAPLPALWRSFLARGRERCGPGRIMIIIFQNRLAHLYPLG